ncbi:amidase [Enterococcus sp. AZ163]|uniref:amidase n=1 Tax=Enterococcus sp. AZ163 TaxID=2774638 RepID=UPI003D28E02B
MKDATYWSKQFKQKEISLADYYQALSQRIQQENPNLNAWVEWSEEELLSQLSDFSTAEDAPFAGVPFPLKMLGGQDKCNWKSTNGSRLFAGVRSHTSSNFTKKIEDLGFVAAGKTNAPEFGFKNITDPILYGPARNPWNTEHSPGGSSGGAAAAVASGIVPIAGASDGGGSIRIPASFCGLIGLKPTRGAMPSGPGGWRGWQGASIDFALTVSMRDTEKLFYALRGNDKAAPYHPPKDEWQSHTIPGSLKIAYLTDSPIGSAVSDEAVKAVRNSLKQLTDLGHEVTEITWPVDGQQLIQSYYSMNAAETSAMFGNIQQQLGRSLTIDDMELMTWGIYQYGEKTPVKKYVNALNLWDQAAAVMEQLFTEYDLFLTPTTAFPAPKIDQELQSDTIRERLANAESLTEEQLASLVYEMFEKSLVLTPFTQLANLTGQPAISLPTHLTAEGLPLGIQFMASKGREDILLAIGQQLEEQGCFVLPESYRE